MVYFKESLPYSFHHQVQVLIYLPHFPAPTYLPPPPPDNPNSPARLNPFQVPFRVVSPPNNQTPSRNTNINQPGRPQQLVPNNNRRPTSPKQDYLPPNDEDNVYSAPPYLPPATTAVTRTTPAFKATTRPRLNQGNLNRPNIFVKPSLSTIEASRQQQPKQNTPRPVGSRQPKQQRFPTTTKPRPTTKPPLKVWKFQRLLISILKFV